MVLGVGVVAPEIEAGTAPSAWVLARSRARWLRGRMLPSLLAATACSPCSPSRRRSCGWRGSRTCRTRGSTSMTPSLHGLILVAKGLAAYGVALAVGALLGRTLPSVILATS